MRIRVRVRVGRYYLCCRRLHGRLQPPAPRRRLSRLQPLVRRAPARAPAYLVRVRGRVRVRVRVSPNPNPNQVEAKYQVCITLAEPLMYFTLGAS